MFGWIGAGLLHGALLLGMIVMTRQDDAAEAGHTTSPDLSVRWVERQRGLFDRIEPLCDGFEKRPPPKDPPPSFLRGLPSTGQVCFGHRKGGFPYMFDHCDCFELEGWPTFRPSCRVWGYE
jgi:hypothetical protein